MAGGLGDPVRAMARDTRATSDQATARQDAASDAEDVALNIVMSVSERPSQRRLSRSRVRFIGGAIAVAAAILAPLAVVAPQTVHAAGPVFQEYQESLGNSPQGITVGPDGNLWVANSFGTNVARLTPSGNFTGFRTSEANVKFVTAGADGNLWFTESTDLGLQEPPRNVFTTPGHIGRLTPAGQLTEFPLPTPFNRPYAITTGADGNVWFTEDGSKIGRVTPAGVITEFPMPTQQGLADDIAPGPDGNVWFPESSRDRIASVTPTGSITEWNLPSGSGPEGLVTGPDNNLWIVESAANKIGRLNIKTHTLTEFGIPTRPADAQLITVGPDGALWFTEAIIRPGTHSAIGRITTDGTIAEFATPPLKRHPSDEPFKIVSGPGGQLWFTEELSSEVVSMTVPSGIAGVAAPSSTTVVDRTPHQSPPISQYSLPGSTPFTSPTTSGSGLVGVDAVGAGPDGNIWVGERSKNAIERMTPTGQITEFPTSGPAQTPTAAPDGNIWYCPVNANAIVRLTPSGVETDFPTPSHCQQIVVGGDGDIWYAGGGVVGRMTTSGAVTEFPIDNNGYIGSGPDGNVWVECCLTSDDNGNFFNNTVRRVAPDGTVTDFPMPANTFNLPGLSPSFAAGQDGNLWFLQDANDPVSGQYISSACRLIIATAAVDCFTVPAPYFALAQTMVAGPEGSLWIAFGGNATGPAGIVRMTVDGVVASKQLFPAGFATPRGMTVGPSPLPNHAGQAVYVAEEGVNSVAVVTSG